MAVLQQTSQRPALWRKIVAGLLDIVTAFFGLGYLVALATGGITEKGFSLEGGPAFLLFGLILAYFIVFNRFLGGTIWKRILRAHG